jgi:hypothetical protein
MNAMESNPSVRRSRFFVVWLGIGLAVFAGCQSEPEPRDPNDILRTLLAETSGSAQFEQRSALPFETLRKAYDADENWVITRDEMQDRDWVRFDRNADDRLTLDDFPTESGALLERVEHALDARIAEGAWQRTLYDLNAFAALDLDRSGTLTRAEYEAAHQRSAGIRDDFSALLGAVRSWTDDTLNLEEWRVLARAFAESGNKEPDS